MKKYEVIGPIFLFHLEEVYRHEDMINHEKLDELIDSLIGCMGFSSYENMLLAKDMFKKGFIAAHIKEVES